MEERKGLVLSHLLGFALFEEFALNIFRFSIPFTPANSIPIRLIALWLVLDRSWRFGRIRMGLWDYIILGFVALTGFGLVFTATTAPGIPVSFDDFRRFIGLFLNAYLYYLVAKEAINRRGFRPDITIKWLLAGLTWSAVIGLMQTLNLLGARRWSLIYASSLLEAVKEQGPQDSAGSSFATGTAAWWNSMALEMLVGFALVFGPTFRRRPKAYEWVLGMLFMAAFIATQSRGGLLAFGACAIATFCWYFFHRKYAIATVIGATVTVGVLVWLFIVFTFKIEKFTISLTGEKLSCADYTQSVSARFQQQQALYAIGARQPLFGTGPSFTLFSGSANFNMWSSYSVNGATDTMYGYMFAQFGLVGLLFLAMVVGFMVFFVRSATAYRPYAFAAFFIGVAFAVHGYVEFLLYSRTFVVMNLLAAYAGSRFLASEEGRTPFSRIVKMVRRQPTAEAEA